MERGAQGGPEVLGPLLTDPTTTAGEGLPSFGALGLLAHPHLWCYDSEGAFPFMPMLLVQARPPCPAPPAPDGTEGSAALLESRLSEACGTVAQALSVLSEEWGEGWSEERFVVLHRAFIPTPCAKLTCERTDELSLMYHACESPLRRSRLASPSALATARRLTAVCLGRRGVRGGWAGRRDD